MKQIVGNSQRGCSLGETTCNEAESAPSGNSHCGQHQLHFLSSHSSPTPGTFLFWRLVLSLFRCLFLIDRILFFFFFLSLALSGFLPIRLSAVLLLVKT